MKSSRPFVAANCFTRRSLVCCLLACLTNGRNTQSASEREAAAAARSELAELREAADKERRTLEGFRDESAELEAGVARRREQERFARGAVEAQQARLDDLKREVCV